jgi:glutamyl-Q tRNA(Asp) synthetase
LGVLPGLTVNRRTRGGKNVMEHVERFAPSPTGRLHLGHAFSAITAHDAARAAGGRFLLRIEDIDASRCRPAFEAALAGDLAWLGLSWEVPPLRQSTRQGAYAGALARLRAGGLLYPCDCTRRDIASALDAPQEGAAEPDGPVYPGTCRGRDESDVMARAHAWRLDMERAIVALGGDAAVAALGFEELDEGPQGQRGFIALDPGALLRGVGDVVLARKDIATSYHLAVVTDDSHQMVSHVTRGRDLFGATAIHRVLQALLGLPTPCYRHHRLIRDASGRRLAKRDAAPALADLRAAGAAPEDIRRMLGL